MLFHNQALYDECRALKGGEKVLPPELEELRARLAKRFNIEILNLHHELVDLVGGAERRLRWDIIVGSEEDRALLYRSRFEWKEDVKEEIREEFLQMIASHRLEERYPTAGIFFSCDVFSEEAINQAVSAFLEKDREALLAVFAADRVWAIEGYSRKVVVFFEDEEAKRNAGLSGADKRLRGACYYAVKQYDEFDYLNEGDFLLDLDSKEVLDRHFGGSLFYYFK